MVTESNNIPPLVEAGVVSCFPPSRIEMEVLADLVFVQPLLKWLHQPEFVKNVML